MERALGLLRGKGQIRPSRGWGFLAGLGKKVEEKQSGSSLAGGGFCPVLLSLPWPVVPQAALPAKPVQPQLSWAWAV